MWTGILVSIGVGRTKTLTKVVNDLAKRGRSRPNMRKRALRTMPAGDIWGISRRLNENGESLAYDGRSALALVYDSVGRVADHQGHAMKVAPLKVHFGDER